MWLRPITPSAASRKRSAPSCAHSKPRRVTRKHRSCYYESWDNEYPQITQIIYCICVICGWIGENMAVDQLTISDEQLLDKLGTAREQLLREIRKAIIGQDEVVEQVLLALFVGGHSIITGVPGLAKTLLVRTIANVLDLSFKRIQFTPDLMPADITGTEIIEEDRATG